MSKRVPLRAEGNYDAGKASKAAQLLCLDGTRTQQHQADETDINLIVKRYTQTGVLPQSALQPLYGDFASGFDFHAAQNRIRAAEEAFMRIPAEIRSRFDNDPGKFVDFALKAENEDELIKLKLRNPKPAPTPSPRAASEPAGGDTSGPSNQPSTTLHTPKGAAPKAS